MTEIQLSSPPSKVIPFTDFSEEQSYPCLFPFMFLLTDNFSKFNVTQSTNEGAIQMTTY
jgi:hypothetical protein